MNETMSKIRITYVVEYDSAEDCPRVGAGMEIAGGKAVAVQFNDALAELEDARARDNVAEAIAFGKGL